MRVLLVEDNISEAELVSDFLEGYSDIELLLCSCIANAKATLAHNQIDVILLDLQLPDSFGAHTLKEIRKQNSSIPIVVLTSNSEPQLIRKLLSSGAQDYLIKGTVDAYTLKRSLDYATLRKRADQLEHTLSKQRAYTEFSTALAHDIKMPINGINNLLDILLSGACGPVNPEQKRALQLLQESSQDLLEQVSTLLEVYRYETANPDLLYEEIDFERLIKDILDKEIISRHRPSAKIETMIPSHLPRVSANRKAICCLIKNLVSNALKFTPADGVVLISANVSTDKIVILVKDTGCGITARDQDKLFKRWWQGEPGCKYVASTGLGLYLCAKIVEAHHGTISCESQVNVGTTFQVTLPVSANEKLD